MSIQSSSHKNSFSNKLMTFLFKTILIVLLTTQSNAMVIFSNIEKPELGYYKAVLNRFYNWYNLKYFNFDNKLTLTEKKFVHLMIDEINQSKNFVDPKTEMPRWRLSLEKEGTKLFFGNLWISIEQNNKSEKELLLKIINDRGIKIMEGKNGEEIYGIEWAFDKDEISIFFLKEEPPNKKSEYETTSLIQNVYKNKIKSEVISWRQLKNIDGKMDHLSNEGISEIWDVVSKAKIKKYVITNLFPSKKFGEQLRDPLRAISNEFNYVPQAILIENENNLKIYYQ